MFEGSLEHGELLPTLRWISALREGGLLSVQGEPDLVSVTFDGGAIVAADAMNRPAEEMLGEVLARRGLLDPAKFAAAVEPFMGTGRLASEVLAERGLVKREDLLDAVREQTYSQVLRLLRWDSGNFNWTPKVESPFEVGMRPISVAELLLRAGEDLGVEGPLRRRPAGLDEVFQAADEPDREVLTIGRDAGWEPGATQTLWITPVEEQLLTLLRQHPSSGARLVAEAGLDPLEVRYGLHELCCASLVSPMEGTVPVPVDEDLVERPSELDLSPTFDDQAESAWSSVPALEPLHDEPEGISHADSVVRIDSEHLEDGVDSFEGPLVAAEARSAESWSAESWSGFSFESPDTAEAFGRTSRRPRRTVTLQRTATWLARGLGSALSVVILVLLVVPGERSSLSFPFPWQQEARTSFQRAQVAALYDKIDRSVRTYYLLYGRYPEELGILVDLELLRERELFDPHNRWLQYAALDDGYTLRPVESGPPGAGLEVRAELRSDFFLNPAFVELPAQSSNPVVLLD
ncbi:MAG TPA: DUF4388 domain-containing protein [Thermoanaerobaculia bacterium]|nr:DUF4388 domain-containing protein [Thermoanaerobaculia bacterium]